MRILILSSEFPPGPGGIGTHAFHIANELHRSGCSVAVISPQDYAHQKEIDDFHQNLPFEFHRLAYAGFAPIKAIQRSLTINHWLHNLSPDIIVASGARATWMMASLARFTRTPWLAVGHGTEFGGRLTLEKRATRIAFNQADAVICVSQYTCTVMQQLGIIPKQVRVIRNGADDSLFYKVDTRQNRSILNEIGVSDETNVLLTVGNVTRRKGQEVIIRAMPAILSRYPNTVYLILGLPTEKNVLSKLADDLGVQESIRFLGRRPAGYLAQLYQACDIFLMTSQKQADGDFEGFGISVIEAALCGKPAVVSQGSGLEEAVVDGVTGLCVPESDPERTAEAVINLLQNPERRLQMGKEAHQRAVEGFTWKIVGQKYLEFLQEIMNPSKVCQ